MAAQVGGCAQLAARVGGWNSPCSGTSARCSVLFCTGLLAVDMPIGLPEAGARDCDRQARALLGPRRSSVFPAPPRLLLDAQTYAEACALRRSHEGKAISLETYNILPKIREVDALMSPALQDRVKEAHPELAFQSLNNGVPLAHSKKQAAGREQRLALVESCLPSIRGLLSSCRPAGTAVDDILDACALVWTAERITTARGRRLPSEPRVDNRGLRMEIWYGVAARKLPGI